MSAKKLTPIKKKIFSFDVAFEITDKNLEGSPNLEYQKAMDILAESENSKKLKLNSIKKLLNAN